MQFLSISVNNDYYLAVGLFALSAIIACLTAFPTLKYLQLSTYRSREFISWLKQSKYDYLIRYFSLGFFSLAGAFVFASCFRMFDYVRYLGLLFYILLGIAFFVITSRSNQKSKLVFTPRAIRLYFLSCVFIALFTYLFSFLCIYSTYFTLLSAALALLTPLCVLFANLILTPFEKLNNKRYIKAAKNTLSRFDLIKIGITGSYGKTTVKNLLCAVLSEKYRVCVTPGNYNTPMGITKTVNGQLKSDDEIFIAEMGARFKGDIKELCDIVSPSIGILTAIGDQHLETFKTKQALMEAKYELFESSVTFGVFGESADTLYDRFAGDKTLVKENDNYKNVRVTENGTEFDLNINGEYRAVKCKLLGRHIAEAAALCVPVALKLGVSPEQIVSALENAEPVPHRLQLIVGAFPIIDDAYNSNPQGALNAIEVLSEFAGSKIIITPGFVEMGALEESENLKLGAEIAAKCDYAFVSGRRAETIRKGAIEAGMDSGRITIVPTLKSAVELLNQIPGEKAVLFENDLPDNIK